MTSLFCFLTIKFTKGINMNLEEKEICALIAVVDDNELSRRSVVEILENADYQVVGSAINARKALELQAATSPNIFIIDIVMPETSGIELAKKILDKDGDVGIIMTSSLNSESIVIEVISSGAMDFLKKPFTKEDLISSVEKVKEIVLGN